MKALFTDFATEAERPYHPVADLFPLMAGEEFEELCDDIERHGNREAILLHADGSIIDGRNRHRACVARGRQPKFEVWHGEDSKLVDMVVSLNMVRRHLTSMQKAVVATNIMEYETAEAAKRMSAGAHKSNNPDPQYTEALFPDEVAAGEVGCEKSYNPPETGRATAIAAQKVGTNHRYVDIAMKAREESPEVFKAMADGSINGSQAQTIMRQPEAIRAPIVLKMAETGEKKVLKIKREILAESIGDAPPVPTGKYRVFYVDPPWSYGNNGVIDENRKTYGKVEDHYPSMTIPELCAMGEDVKGITDDNAVMFMWVTSPFLEECFAVIRAWGFKYKASFVWDKIGHNYGHYNSVRHEFLLICTKGSCTPDAKELFDSVQSIEKSRKHSEKPEHFRQIIDHLYTWGDRIELFSRKIVEGWAVWGNQAGEVEIERNETTA